VAPELVTDADVAVRHARLGRAAILLAAVAWSTAGLGQRELGVSPATQVGGRAAFAGVALLLLVAALERRATVRAFLSLGRWELLAAVLLGVSSGTFMLALSFTTVANVLFMQAAAPFMAALLGWWLLSERVAARTWAAMSLAGLGVVLMAAGSVSRGMTAVALPLVMTASFAGVIVIARYRRQISLLPATCVSQPLVFLVALPFASFGAASEEDWAIMLALGFAQMGLGLALLTVGARLIPPAEVALISLLEVVLGPLWVWLAYGERPGAVTLAGGAIVTVAVLIQATSRIAAAGAPAPVRAAPERSPP
jgi:drug/metabolite transporter (DMT)-like permease